MDPFSVRTRNVDMTITNFLEGTADLGPSPVQDPQVSTEVVAPKIQIKSKPINLQQQKDIDVKNLNMAAESFGKSANERMLSFQERKALLIEKARRRYIEKHGLTKC